MKMENVQLPHKAEKYNFPAVGNKKICLGNYIERYANFYITCAAAHGPWGSIKCALRRRRN